MPADTLPNWPAMSIAQANEMLAAEGSPLELMVAVINGVALKIYKNAPPTIPLVLQLASMQYADRDFIVYEDERVTFDALARAVVKLAAVMRDTYGIEKGDRVAIVMRNYPQWPVAFFAASMLGAIATPMNSWWTSEELEYGLSFAGVKLAFVDPQIYERVRTEWEKLPDLKNVIIARDPEGEYGDPRVSRMERYGGGANEWDNLPEVAWPAIDLEPEDNATSMYTSGT
ncbi:unnamed protein product, partial [Scytosiphon promiscuus]